jgi:hypothetical protein
MILISSQTTSMATRHRPGADLTQAADGSECAGDLIEELRSHASEEDADGRPLWNAAQESPAQPKLGSSSRRHQQPPRPTKAKSFSPRPSHQEVERRIAEAQLWIAQRLPLVDIRANARQNWGITNVRTVSRYLSLARQRMVEELIQNRLQHQAEQIYGLNELIHQAMAAGQFNAAVGAFRVIAEIGGLLRAPLKAPESRP